MTVCQVNHPLSLPSLSSFSLLYIIYKPLISYILSLFFIYLFSHKRSLWIHLLESKTLEISPPWVSSVLEAGSSSSSSSYHLSIIYFFSSIHDLLSAIPIFIMRFRIRNSNWMEISIMIRLLLNSMTSVGILWDYEVVYKVDFEFDEFFCCWFFDVLVALKSWIMMMMMMNIMLLKVLLFYWSFWNLYFGVVK